MTRAKIQPINSRWNQLPVEVQNKIIFHAAEKNFLDKVEKVNQARAARLEAMSTPETRNLRQRMMGIFRPSRRDMIQQINSRWKYIHRRHLDGPVLRLNMGI